jgi:glycosyltransferase involved in cell wall biosynthesis
VLHPATVDILLATYNGARFVKCQIDSILERMRPGWRILVRDDGSTDSTVEILERLARRWPECITLVPNRDERLGPSGNFARLMKHATADYILFSDQDDVWLPGRIDLPLERIQALESAHGSETPILVHTDLAVVDESLRRLGPSFWQYSGIDPRGGDAIGRLLVRNVVTGCATTFNRALARLACPIPSNAIMHDWWLALVASGCGRLEYISEPTVLYRQHQGNCIGAQPWQWPQVLRRNLFRLVDRSAAGEELRMLSAQARALLQRTKRLLSPENRTTVEALADLQQWGFFRRRYEALCHGLLKCDLASNIGWLALL